MAILCIRDDDVSYWTESDSFKKLYDPLWMQGIPVSLAVIPYAVESYHRADRTLFYQNLTGMPIGENKSLVVLLRNSIKQGLVEIMLHGYNHTYRVGASSKIQEYLPANKANLDRFRTGDKTKKLIWIGEYQYDIYEELITKTIQAKEYLESLFGVRINIFVPPSNQLSADGARAVIRSGLNISGIIGRRNDRPIDHLYVMNWLKRWVYRLIYNKPYPYVLTYKMHRELVAYALTHQTDIAGYHKLIQGLPNNAPFVLATHSWELLQYPDLLQNFYGIINEVKKSGAVIKPLGDVL